MNSAFQKNRHCKKLAQMMLENGEFTTTEIAQYSEIVAFHYGNSVESEVARKMVDQGQIMYWQVIGFSREYKYNQLRAKLRRFGLMAYDPHSQRWTVKHPLNWLYSQISGQIKAKVSGKPTNFSMDAGGQLSFV